MQRVIDIVAEKMNAKWFWEILLQFQKNCNDVFGNEFFFVARTQGNAKAIPELSTLFCNDSTLISDGEKRGYKIKSYEEFGFSDLQELWKSPYHWDFEFYLYLPDTDQPELTFAFYSYLPGVEVRFNFENISGKKVNICLEIPQLLKDSKITDDRSSAMEDNWNFPITDSRFDSIRA